MNLEDTAKLLAVAAIVDNRHVDREMIIAWNDILGDMTLDEASDALREHRRTSTEYLQPVHIIRLVKAERRRLRWDEKNQRPFPPPGKRYAVDVIEYGELE